jgi:hypothetical protein
LTITFSRQPIYRTPQLKHFISRTPNFKAQNKARVFFSDWDVWVTFDEALELGVSWNLLHRQLPSLVQVCGSSLPQALFPAVELLYILDNRMWDEEDGIENSQWLEFLHSFTAVEGLYLSREFTPRIARVLQDLVGERVTEVLPALQTLFLEEPLSPGPVQETIGQFVAARQLASRPIAVSLFERDD